MEFENQCWEQLHEVDVDAAGGNLAAARQGTAVLCILGQNPTGSVRHRGEDAEALKADGVGHDLRPK